MAEFKVDFQTPEGWKVVAYRRPEQNEFYLYTDGVLQQQFLSAAHAEFPILEPEFVPRGWKVVAFRRPRRGEWYLHDGSPLQASVDHAPLYPARVILAPRAEAPAAILEFLDWSLVNGFLTEAEVKNLTSACEEWLAKQGSLE